MQINFKYNTKCPVCGDKLVVIDNYNYITMICPSCHTTVFEEFNHNVHVIKNGIMADGYNSSLDIFYKQLIAHSIYANSLSSDDFEEFWSEKLLIGILHNEDILANGIYDYFINKIKNFKLKQSCIYFDGYEQYLEMSKKDADNFKKYYE